MGQVRAGSSRERLRPLLRLSLRDALRHPVRTVLMLVIIAVPLAACVLAISASTPQVLPREQALAELPNGVQASLLDSTLPRPTRQVPESFPLGIRDESITPTEDVKALLPPGSTLHEWWSSPTLIATTALDLAPGQQGKATAGRMVGDLDPTHLSTVTLREADAATLAFMVPEVTRGRYPTSPNDIVVTATAAENAQVSLGDTLQLIAPPDTGWRGSDGRVAEVVQDAQRGYRVVGIVDDAGASDAGARAVGVDHGGAGATSGAFAWALPGWVAPMIQRDQTGVDRHLLVTGDRPVTWQQVRALNDVGVVAISRDVLTHYPPADELYPVPVDVKRVVTSVALVVLSLGGMAALLFALVTPAITTGAERMRRTFGLIVAIGATPRGTAVMLLLGSMCIGLVGSFAGVVVGLGGARGVGVCSGDGGAGDVCRFPPSQYRAANHLHDRAWNGVDWYANSGEQRGRPADCARCGRPLAGTGEAEGNCRRVLVRQRDAVD